MAWNFTRLSLKRKRTTHGNPFLAWTDLAWQSSEMWVASAAVIAHRTARMASAGPMPNARDRREFAQMAPEKFAAAAESAHAMSTHVMAMNVRYGKSALRHYLSGMNALVALATSSNAAQAFARQAQLAQALTGSAANASDFAHSTARLASAGLKPIHARATANARRLARG